jgi:hypothetical protein
VYTEVDEYIRANRDRYTREAITAHLVAAGHDRAAVEAAWQRAEAPPGAAARPTGWRPRWAEFFVLVILGAIGAAIVWAEEPYGAGGIAPVVYVIIVTIGFALGKAISLLVDAGNGLTAAVMLALVAIGGAFLSLTSALPWVALAVALLAGIPALLLIYLRGNPRGAGMVGALVPVLVWLAVTGTCYAPLYGRITGT